jgi:hypothetical protein
LPRVSSKRARPIESAPQPNVRDALQLVIHVEDNGKERVLRVSEPLSGLTDALRDFIQLVRKQADVVRSTAGSQQN